MMTGNGPEPENGTFVVASVLYCPDRTYWERNGELWYCECCGNALPWDALVDPIEETL